MSKLSFGVNIRQSRRASGRCGRNTAFCIAFRAN